MNARGHHSRSVSGLSRRTGRGQGFSEWPPMRRSASTSIPGAGQVCPFYVRAGKSLEMTVTEVFVEFKLPPQVVFHEPAPPVGNHVRLRLGPQVAIAVGARAKRPGEGMVGRPWSCRWLTNQPTCGSVIMNGCWATLSPATRLSSRGRMSSKRPGRSWIRWFRIPGPCSNTSRAPGDRSRRIVSWLRLAGGTRRRDRLQHFGVSQLPRIIVGVPERRIRSWAQAAAGCAIY